MGRYAPASRPSEALASGTAGAGGGGGLGCAPRGWRHPGRGSRKASLDGAFSLGRLAQEKPEEALEEVHVAARSVPRKKRTRRAGPDFEATTKGVHRGPVTLPCGGDIGRLSPAHGSVTGPKEQRSWGSNLAGKLGRGGTPQHAGLGIRSASSSGHSAREAGCCQRKRAGDGAARRALRLGRLRCPGTRTSFRVIAGSCDSGRRREAPGGGGTAPCGGRR